MTPDDHDLPVEQMTAWRRDLHAHPETAFEEHRTSDLVAETLAGFGIEVTRGLARTGVVGTLRKGSGGRAIGLRADMDALPMTERTGLSYASTTPGRMHGCGHDGHTAMLLGAAKWLAERGDFSGTVRFVFQPAEEMAGGGRLMVEDGLFERFPVDAIYGLHNWPRMAFGTFATRPGPLMAATNAFSIVIRGKGTHAAMPDLGIDPVPCAAQVVTALQRIAAREVSPLDAVVVSVTMIHGGETENVIPETVSLGGTIRSFREDVRESAKAAMRRIASGIASAHNCTVEVEIRDGYPPTVNHPAETETALAAAAAIAGTDMVERAPTPSMGAEDFAYMLEKRPGCYMWMGTGTGPDTPGLHHPAYDFNDRALGLGARYWIELVRRELGK